jgi:hypothetical protein
MAPKGKGRIKPLLSRRGGEGGSRRFPTWRRVVMIRPARDGLCSLNTGTGRAAENVSPVAIGVQDSVSE